MNPAYTESSRTVPTYTVSGRLLTDHPIFLHGHRIRGGVPEAGKPLAVRVGTPSLLTSAEQWLARRLRVCALLGHADGGMSQFEAHVNRVAGWEPVNGWAVDFTQVPGTVQSVCARCGQLFRER